MKSEFTISHKKRMQDSVCIYGKYYKVSSLIESNPLLLWRAIHKVRKKNGGDDGKSRESQFKNKTLSLVRPAYDLLKKAVSRIAPEEVLKVEAKFEQKKQERKLYKIEKKLQNEIVSGKLGTSSSRFRKL